MTTTILALGAAALLAVVHLTAGRLRFLEGIPRSRWLSGAGGVSVAYVFVHLLPELAEGQAAFERAELPGWLRALEQHLYVLALAGLAVFYGLERFTTRARGRAAGGPHDGREAGRSEGNTFETSPRVFWVSIGLFALYNALIGYLLLHRADRPLHGLALYTVAMALHFVVNDFGLREHHKRRYHAAGRWLLAGAIVVGTVLGLLVRLPEAAVAAVLAFLAGGVVLNVLKEELPEERESCFSAFALGTAAYAILLLAASAWGAGPEAARGGEQARHAAAAVEHDTGTR